jgi:uncharacterized protein with von Willebrand factor type A (vWA) domain
VPAFASTPSGRSSESPPEAPSPPRHEADEILLGFARALRAAGAAVTADREATYLVAAATVGLDDEWGLYHAGRATLCSTPQDLERYDQVYAAWFSGQPVDRSREQPPAPTVVQADLSEEAESGADEGEDQEVLRAVASATEVLRHRDVAEMSVAEREALAALFSHIVLTPPVRPAHRHTPWRRGVVDTRATLRDHLRRMGEPGPIRWRHRGSRARRVVLLIDVSGSMSAYADALLRLAHRFVASGAPVEVFTMGTRLTHVTRAMRQRDPDRAIAAAGETVPDWSGGTRLGEALGVFLDRWGRRGMARGAVVVLFSDGWEREGPDVLAEQMRRTAALAHRVIWVNPHRGKAGYEPVQQGMAAALPYVDDFVAGHSMATFEELTEVVGRA